MEEKRPLHLQAESYIEVGHEAGASARRATADDPEDLSPELHEEDVTLRSMEGASEGAVSAEVVQSALVEDDRAQGASSKAPGASAKATDTKRSFLSTALGKVLLGVVVVVLVLLLVVATSGQHTSHALTATFMQIADSNFEQICVFNIS